MNISNDDIAISVKHVSKNFRLPHEKTSSIKSGIVHIFKKKNKTIETQHALKDITFEIKKGEFFGIVGRNGSGKSTLLKILAEIYTPSQGKIETNGKIVPFIELGVGFNPELTGKDNVYLNGSLLGFSRIEIDNLYDEIVEFAELERFMDQKLKNYSSGMQVRLAFSIAIKARADILILDEVLAVGDESFQRKCYEYFQELRDDKKTVILVSHSMDAVRTYCSRAVLLNNGRIEVDSSDVDTVADAYSKLFVENTETSHNEKDRYGSGEIVFNKISKKTTNRKLVLKMDVENKTTNSYRGVYIGINVKSEGNLVTGNHLRYAKGYENGLTFKSKERKELILEFDNILSKNDYSIDLNIRANSGTLNFDTINNAVKLNLANSSGSKFYKVQMPLTVSEREKNDSL